MASEAHGQASEEEVMEIAGRLTKRERLDLRRYIRGSSICRTSGKTLVELGIIIPARFVGGKPIDADYVSDLGRRVASVLGDAK